MSVCFELTQESENALAIRIRDAVFQKLKDCTSEEQLREELLAILRDNDETLDLEKLQTDEDLTRILDSFVACSVTTVPDNLDGKTVQIGDFLRNAIDTICTPPTLSIPYPLPTIDLTDDFLNKLLLALVRLAINILLSIIKKLLSLIIDICNTGLNSLNGYGIDNISKIIADSVGQGVSQSFIGEVFNSFGINTDGTSAILTIGEEEECTDETFREAVSNVKSVSKFLDDLSMMATPVELCSLLNNKANDSTLLMVEELLTFEYPEIKKRLNNRSKIITLFKTLGSRSDPSICQLIEDNSEKVISRPDLCFSGDMMQVRKNLLKERNLTDDQIKNVLDKERQKVKTNLEKVSQLAAAIRTNPDRIFGEPPNIFCKGNQSGLFNLDDMPSLKDSLNDGIDVSFNMFATVYSSNSSNFVSNILSTYSQVNLEEPIIQKFSDKFIIDNDGEEQLIENSINDKFLQRTSNGRFTLCDEFGRTDKDSLLDYYDFEINNQQVIVNDTIDKQLLVSNLNYDAHDENVYILNYIYSSKVTPDVINIIDKIEDYIQLDYENLCINFALPNKLVLPNSIDNTGDFNLVPSMQTIKLFTVSGSST